MARNKSIIMHYCVHEASNSVPYYRTNDAWFRLYDRMDSPHPHSTHTSHAFSNENIYIYKYLCVGRVWQNHVLKCSSVRVASSNFPKVVVRFTNCSGISICETGGNKIWWHAKGLTIRIFETNIHNYGVTFAVNSAMRSRGEWTHSLSITGLYILSYTSHICVYLSVCWTKLRCSKAQKKKSRQDKFSCRSLTTLSHVLTQHKQNHSTNLSACVATRMTIFVYVRDIVCVTQRCLSSSCMNWPFARRLLYAWHVAARAVKSTQSNWHFKLSSKYVLSRLLIKSLFWNANL